MEDYSKQTIVMDTALREALALFLFKWSLTNEHIWDTNASIKDLAETTRAILDPTQSKVLLFKQSNFIRQLKKDDPVLLGQLSPFICDYDPYCECGHISFNHDYIGKKWKCTGCEHAVKPRVSVKSSKSSLGSREKPHEQTKYAQLSSTSMGESSWVYIREAC